MHLGVTLAFLVLGRTRSSYDRCIYNSSTIHDQPGFFQAIRHIPEDLFSDVMFSRQVPELQQGYCVRNPFVKEIDLEKLSHGVAVIDSFFHSFIGQVEPVLHKIHAKHDLNIDWSAAALIVVIIRLDYSDPMTPWDDFIHGIKEFFSLGFPPTFGISMSLIVN